MAASKSTVALFAAADTSPMPVHTLLSGFKQGFVEAALGNTMTGYVKKAKASAAPSKCTGLISRIIFA